MAAARTVDNQQHHLTGVLRARGTEHRRIGPLQPGQQRRRRPADHRGRAARPQDPPRAGQVRPDRRAPGRAVRAAPRRRPAPDPRWTAPGAQRRRRRSARAAAGRPCPLRRRRPALQLEQDARADVRQRHTYSGSGPEVPQHRRAATTATSLCGDIHLRVEPCTDSVGFVPKVTTDATRRRSEALSTPLIKGLHGDAEIGGYINWRP